MRHARVRAPRWQYDGSFSKAQWIVLADYVLGGEAEEAHARLELRDGVAGAGDGERGQEGGEVRDGDPVFEGAEAQQRGAGFPGTPAGKLLPDMAVKCRVCLLYTSDAADE